MALVSTTNLTITVAVPGFTPQGGSAGSAITFTGASGADKTEFGGLSRVQEVLETTSLGEGHRTRVRQGLEDLGEVDVSFYYQSGGGATTGNAAATSTDAEANLTRAFAYAYAQGANVTTVHTYAAGHTVTAEWIVSAYELTTDVAENVMVSCHLMPTGVWTFSA